MDFVRYVFAESRFALVAVVLWLGFSALSLLLFRQFQNWADAGFLRQGWAIVTVIYANLVFTLVFGLTLEYLANLIFVDWLETGGDQPNRTFTAIGLTITVIALVITGLTIQKIRKIRRATRTHTIP